MKWLEKRRQKRQEYWDNLDLDRELKIQKIKTEKSKQDSNYSRGLLFSFLAFMIPLILFSVISLFTFLSTHFYNQEHYDQLVKKNEVVYPETVSAAVHDESLSTSYDELDPNTIVNFNQLSNEINIQHGGTFSSVYRDMGLTYFPTLNSSHYYFVKMNFTINSGSADAIAIFNQNNSEYIFSTSNHIINGWTRINLFRVYGTVGNSYDINTFVSIIDLTLMFGSNDNIPSLDQCNELFLSPYYSYTSGTAMMLNSLSGYADAYQNALNDVFASYQYIQSTSALGTNTFSYNYGGQNSEFSFNNTYNTYYFLNTFAVPLHTTLSAGTKITLEYQFWANGFNDQLYHLNVLYPTNVGMTDSALANVAVSPDFVVSNGDTVSENTHQVFEFTLPHDLDTLYFNFINSNTNNIDTGANGFFFYFQIKASGLNINMAIENAYNSGLDSASQKYYTGGAAYNAIYNQGYNQGLVDQNPYTFSALMSSVIEAPLDAALSVFNFEFLGVNLKNVVTVLFTVAILVAILGLFIGGKS